MYHVLGKFGLMLVQHKIANLSNVNYTLCFVYKWLLRDEWVCRYKHYIYSLEEKLFQEIKI